MYHHSLLTINSLLAGSINSQLVTRNSHFTNLRPLCSFKDTSSNFEELLIKAASVTVHQKNLQLLTTEIYKTKHDLNPKFIGEIFVEKNISCSLRCNDHMSVPIPRTNAYGIETIRYTGHKLWQSLPLEIKESNTLTEFKRKIKQHYFSDCNCRLCKTYVNNLGFL